MSKRSTILILVTVAFFSLLYVEDASTANSEFVTTKNRFLYVSGGNFYFNGANQYYLPFKPRSMVDEILQDAQQLGLNVIRTWGFADGQGMDGRSFQPEPGVYDEETFLNMDYIIYRANQLNIRLIIPLVNNWNEFGGMNKYVEWSPSAVAHDDFYTDEYCKTLYKNYVSHFLNRVNTYTGIAYKDDPTIMVWELANEADCESDKTGTKLYNWVEEMASFIKSIDQNHLVSTGETGWYVDKGADWMHNGSKGTDFIRNSQSGYIDVSSFHLYPNIYNMTESQALSWIEEHLNDAHFTAGKPAYLGEFGWRVPREILGDFSHGSENWRADFGFSASSPVRTTSPSQNGNGSITYFPNGVLGAYQYAAGERWLDSAIADFSPYNIINAWVHIPSSGAADMEACIYTKSGDDWIWREGQAYPLVPGEWNNLVFYTVNSYMPQKMKSVGVRIRNGAADYTGPVYYDMIAACSNLAGETAEDRNRVYGAWYESLNTNDADGAILWILNGHQPDTTFFPDYDEYGVYYPEDAPTCAGIKSYSDIVAGKNSGAPQDMPPSVAISYPQNGQTVSGTVVIRAVATDDKGINTVSYSINSGPAQSMVFTGNDAWEGSWNSGSVSNGAHLIFVRAEDTLSQSASSQVNVNVNNAVEKKVRIKGIDLTLTRKGKGGVKKQCFATVYVVDDKNKPVSGAAVYTHWSGLANDSDVTMTDMRGMAKNIPSNETTAASGYFRITVDDVVKAGYRYAAELNTETSDEKSL